MKFDSFHPAINLIYFIFAIAFALWFSHPVYVGIAFAAAVIFSFSLKGSKAVKLDAVVLVIMAAVFFAYIALVHFGSTVIFRLNGNGVTLESMAGALRWAFSVGSVLIFLSCFFHVFSVEKIIYIFGRVFPKAALFLAVFFHSYSQFKIDRVKIARARKGIGKSGSISAAFSKFTESFFEKSISMKNRGVTLKGRTAFSVYRFDNRDRIFVLVMALCAVVTLMAAFLNQTTIYFDPVIIMNHINAASIIFYLFYAALLLLPALYQIIAEIRFRSLLA